ncbi:hypothetical protein LIER_05559 [Lithospermum erythrorhizon]|uniref:Uncharacterized protein n=1 Tax=Lithospermum erythrorhizon TaxID=34254 RepID=A0AAV3P3N1_LITER
MKEETVFSRIGKLTSANTNREVEALKASYEPQESVASSFQVSIVKGGGLTIPSKDPVTLQSLKDEFFMESKRSSWKKSMEEIIELTHQRYIYEQTL